ncbi:hypothetical protein FHS15_003384 [Paenibacillus castaneae]|uniref:copper amine oxidase N-terminal domain-containing protein n=1 Tax=Paenibacillus castaneae TaxID=474957 RepID=UPI000C9B8BB3|nr:copper amine oxidase N-terminal domain-containing protein [Paenibacillus castaneae]NIK78246.1 hypothetical protein [Paenibacillus castaneae]
MGIKKRWNKGIAVTAILTATILATIMPGGLSYHASASESNAVQFQIGSKQAVDSRGEHTLREAPFLLNGHAMVPVRALAGGLQAELEWNEAEKTIFLTRSGLTVHLILNSDSVVGSFIKGIKLPEKVMVVNGTAFVPAKSVAQLLGANTSWNASDKKVMIQANEDISNALK